MIARLVAFIVSLTFWLVGVQHAQAANPAEVGSFQYAYNTNGNQSMTATYNTSRQDAPWAMLVHGGSWINGSQRNMVGFASTFYNQGYQVFNLSYSVGPTVTFLQQLRDLQYARDYIKAHASAFHLNPNRGVVVGFSAGGHLAAEVGNTGGFKAVVSASGVLQPQRFPEMVAAGNTDGELNYINSREATMTGCHYTRLVGVGTCGASWKRFEPQYGLGRITPATYVIQGEADPILPPHSAISYYYWLGYHHVAHRALVMVPGYGHDPAEVLASPTRVAAMIHFLHANGA